MDTLSNVVQMLRLKARVFLYSNFCGNYAVETAGSGKATFHVVAEGECWLHMPELQEPVQLYEGDLIIFPHDAEHTLSNKSVFPSRDVPRNRYTSTPQGEYVSIICGDIDFMQSRWNPVLESLPSYLVLSRGGQHHTTELEALISFMIEETRAGLMGSDAVIDRFSDVLFIHVLRAYLAKERSQSSYLAALFDARIGPVIKAIHDAPENNWTVQSLAEQARMSRSAFAEYFHGLVGVSPIEYVTNWRMQVAYEQLSTSDRSTAQIAETCGYQSESSFSKAFKKHFGINPGAVRRNS
ncbi:MAG TPA: hypothetical protein DDW55_15000 [Gammaproteobacteria bacterium]|nr:hypothetical protein [Gammaproteobacteria bacterium]